MEQGSTVVMYDPAERLYHIGVIAGPCSPVPEPEGITYTRAVTWNKTAPRDVLSQSSKNSLGGIQTIFAISAEVMADLESAASHKRPAAAPGSPATPTRQLKIPATTHLVTTRRSPPHTTTASNSSRTA